MRKPIGITYPLSILTETPEEKDAFEHIENTTRGRVPHIPPGAFAGNYQGPLYSPHPDIIQINE